MLTYSVASRHDLGWSRPRALRPLNIQRPRPRSRSHSGKSEVFSQKCNLRLLMYYVASRSQWLEGRRGHKRPHAGSKHPDTGRVKRARRSKPGGKSGFVSAVKTGC